MKRKRSESKNSRRRARSSQWLELLHTQPTLIAEHRTARERSNNKLGNEENTTRLSARDSGHQLAICQNEEEMHARSGELHINEDDEVNVSVRGEQNEQNLVACPTPTQFSWLDLDVSQIAAQPTANDIDDQYVSHLNGDRGERTISWRDYLRLFRRILLPWTNILGFVAVCGSVRYTVAQYDMLRSIMGMSVRAFDLPSYSKIQRTIFPHILKYCFPKSSIVIFNVHVKKRRTGVENIQSGGGEVLSTFEAPVRVILPPEWAKLDVLMHPFHEMVFNLQTEDELLNSIESSDIIQGRAAMLNAGEYIYAYYNGKPIRAFPGGKVVVDVRFKSPQDSLLYPDLNRNMTGGYNVEYHQNHGCTIRAVIAAVWCVGSIKRVSASYKKARKYTAGGVYEMVGSLAQANKVEKKGRERLGHHSNRRGKSRNRCRSNPQSLSANIALYDPHLLPGDICCLLRPQESLDLQSYALVVVYRYWMHVSGLPSVRMLALRVPSRAKAASSADRGQYSKVFEDSCVTAYHEVRNPINLYCDATEDVDRARGAGVRKVPKVRNMGKLQNGKSYVVYRVLLYCDDFSPYSPISSSGSAGGCYMLPIGLPHTQRTARTATRLIGLTPPGVSSRKLLLHIIPNLLRATTEGIEGQTSDGRSVKIFIDVLGFLGDYLESAHGTDLLGHNADAPCTCCSIRRYKHTKSSTLGYSTTIHSCNSSAVRFGDRHWALRESGVDNDDCRFLGMCENAKVSNESCPLLVLQVEMEKHRPAIAIASDGVPVVPGLFDAYRSNFVAPDHLLTGVSKNILSLSFCSLPSKAWKQRMDELVCSALAENGLITHRTVFDVSRNNLLTMTLSGTFCLLLVAVPIFETIVNRIAERDEIYKEVLEAMRCLQELIGLTYWWPKVGRDSPGDVSFFYEDNKAGYFAKLQSLACSYVLKANDLCTRMQLAMSHLDKPNLHRLLELYFHTLPGFGHARHVTELVLENAHQPLKRCMIRSNHKDAQVTSVEHCLGDDWQRRVSLLHEGLQSSDRNQDRYRRGLRRLILGSTMDDTGPNSTDENLDRREEDSCRIAREADILVSSLLAGPLPKVLARTTYGCRLTSSLCVWITVGELAEDVLRAVPIGVQGVFDISNLTVHSEGLLYEHIPNVHTGERWKMRVYKYAKRVRELKSGHSVRISTAHDRVYSGCVVQTLISSPCTDRKILIPGAGINATKRTYAVIGIVARTGEKAVWAIVVECQLMGNRLRVPMEFTESDIMLLSLTDNVHRVAIVHDCAHRESDKCKLDPGSRRVIHEQHILSGGTFLFFDNKAGYPPRNG